MVYRILVASYTNEIFTLAFDPDARSLTLTSTTTVGFHPSWITPHPTDKSIVITALEQADGQIVVLKADEEGRVSVAGEGTSSGHSPCSLVAIGEELLIANYMSGTFAAVPLSKEAPHIVPSQSTVLAFHGTGPDASRQESSHLHQVEPHPTYNEILVPDLGADKVRRLVKAADGKWAEQGTVEYTPGAGPRHVAFYGDVMYTLLELSSEVAAHRLPPLPASPTFLDARPTMAHKPEGALDMLAAEILLPAPNSAFPDPLIYVSNRNDPSPEGDTIAIFTPIDEQGKLGYVGEVRSGLKHLRGMVFGGPDAKWLVAGGAQGGGVKVFERVDGGKGLKEVAAVELEAPTGFLWL